MFAYNEDILPYTLRQDVLLSNHVPATTIHTLRSITQKICKHRDLQILSQISVFYHGSTPYLNFTTEKQFYTHNIV